MKIKSLSISILLTAVCFCSCKDREAYIEAVRYARNHSAASENPSVKTAEASGHEDPYQTYVIFFEEVYKTMDTNYYASVSREKFDHFVESFKNKIYPQLKGEKKSDNYVKWRGAAYLIEKLKTDEDIFSAFYPPEPAHEFKQEALDQKIARPGKPMELGIVGEKVEQGFKTTQVEPRVDAYEKGLRIGDILIKIDDADLAALPVEKIREMLTPIVGTKVKIEYVAVADHHVHVIQVEPREYFKQSVFPINIPVDGIYGLRIEHFNRMTGEDVYRFLNYFRQHGPIKGLVLDLRGNPGGPPLAARELSSFFLKGGADFAYFQRKGQPKSVLDVPLIPQELKYDGPLVILIDKGSGSASELFSGILQREGRAALMGVNSAGQVMMKSMFNFIDGSMALLITSRGYDAHGVPFPFTGLEPDRKIADSEMPDILKYAAVYLIYKNQHPQTN
jgi:C-terminal peptidase prc